MAGTSEQVKTRGVRQVLASVEDVRAAVVETTGLATRALSILTHDLEPEIYDHDDFLNTLKRFILARSFARVRVLILDPARAILTSSRFVTMARRLNTYIEFRNVKPEYRTHPEAFLIADEQALVYRARAESWDGMSDTYEPAVARLYLNTFDTIWNACEIEPELRQLQL
ncbi:MAG TPA: hypothetical protein VFJ95_16860 [Gammaproteobacteria bacterium]|jgi:hypothetical protein|nr:hypothetical protein [Gammaproteobacteria bacterium]